MRTILINTNEIESCWEKSDACFVKMTSGKIWIVNKYMKLSWKPNFIISTKAYILYKLSSVIELPLKTRGGNASGK